MRRYRGKRREGKKSGKEEERVSREDERGSREGERGSREEERGSRVEETGSREESGYRQIHTKTCEIRQYTLLLLLLLNHFSCLSSNGLCICVRRGGGDERWGAGVETQKNVRGEIGG